MDPNVTWQTMVEAAKKMRLNLDIPIRGGKDEDALQDLADDLHTATLDLAEWLNKGGHPPDAFKR